MTSAGALFSGLAKLLDSDPQSMKEKAYFVLSALLEICALAALSIAGIQHGKDLEERFDDEPEDDDEDSPKNNVIHLPYQTVPNVPHRTETPQGEAIG